MKPQDNSNPAPRVSVVIASYNYAHFVPLAIEFWRDRPFRLHDRLVFERADATTPWSKHRLYP